MVIKGECSFPSCLKSARTKGLCSGHYRQHWKGQELKPIRQLPPELRLGSPCQVEACDRPIRSKGMCAAHYYQVARGVTPKSIRPLAEAGSGHLNKDGYRVIFRPGHPNASGRGLIYEHRWLMGEHLGRPLLPGETVHHRNGDRSDNSLTNLELWTSSHPSGQRVQDKVAWARDILALYGDLY